MQVPLLDLTQQYKTLKQELRPVIDTVCDTQSLILGPHVERFEKNLAEYCQATHAIGVSSGTDALVCAMMAIDLKPGDEVICPSFTFFATAGSIARLGATPVFVDIDPRTFNIDVAKIEPAITPRTRAIVPVDLFGQMCRIDEINQIAARHGLVVIEDAAQAIGARRHDKPACSQAHVGCLSFYPTKNLGAFGDAGAICCHDDKLAEKLRKLRVHGSGHTYHHEMIGGMFRLAALQAAVLNVKLKHLEQWHAARRRNADIYNQVLRSSRVITPFIEAGNLSIYNQYVVRVADRDNVKKRLADKGIGSGIYYPLGLHGQPCFAHLGYKTGSLPETERACGEVLALPIFPELSEEQVRYAAETLREIAG
ncbi:MAG: DegT/DnrJ/EryC1/StrS family aminotransferase [Burkholderiales bacterium]|nr:DegT/DnrJ/EryC1/StrS family aminotransferase [Phycisphaerae bacterium]